VTVGDVKTRVPVRGPNGKVIGHAQLTETEEGIELSGTLDGPGGEAFLAAVRGERQISFSVQRSLDMHTDQLQDAIRQAYLADTRGPLTLAHSPNEPLTFRYPSTGELRSADTAFGLPIEADEAVPRGWVHIVDGKGARQAFKLDPARLTLEQMLTTEGQRKLLAAEREAEELILFGEGILGSVASSVPEASTSPTDDIKQALDRIRERSDEPYTPPVIDVHPDEAETVRELLSMTLSAYDERRRAIAAAGERALAERVRRSASFFESTLERCGLRRGEGGASITGTPVSAATSGPEREKKPQKNGESRIGGPQKPAPDDRRVDDQRHVERDRKDTSNGR
jgi:hypothetical protein